MGALGGTEVRTRKLYSAANEDVPDNGILGQWTDSAHNIVNDNWDGMMASRMQGGALVSLSERTQYNVEVQVSINL